MKNSKQMERHFKGIANHWRIDALLLLSVKNDLSLEKIAEELGANLNTVGEHIRRLYQAGLVNKKYRGREVHHSLSPYGEKIVAFMKIFRRL